jgi:hypothetical protein
MTILPWVSGVPSLTRIGRICPAHSPRRPSRRRLAREHLKPRPLRILLDPRPRLRWLPAVLPSRRNNEFRYVFPQPLRRSLAAGAPGRKAAAREAVLKRQREGDEEQSESDNVFHLTFLLSLRLNWWTCCTINWPAY